MHRYLDLSIKNQDAIIASQTLNSSHQKIRICDPFLNNAKQQPNAIAIRESLGSLTYEELNQLSESLAHDLSASATSHNKIIAIYGKRNARLVISMIACARANLTFAVLDSSYPNERIQQMLNIIQPAVLLGIDSMKAALDEISSNSKAKYTTLNIDQNHLKYIKPHSRRHHSVACNSIAYLLFTSGTTGLPKCIKTTHKPLNHFIEWHTRIFNIKPNANFSMLSGLSHDPILRDIFVPLSVGAAINIPDNEIIIHPTKLFQWFKQSKITHTHATPQLLTILNAGAKNNDNLPHLEYVFSGGDALKIKLVKQLNRLNPLCKVVNFYGSTETPQAMAYYKLKAEDAKDPIPIGKAISNVTLHLLRNDLTSAPDGEIGQIGIETEYLSEGYVNHNSMTTYRFVSSTNVMNSNHKIYLTGDYGMRLKDGAIVLKGRMDDQVKIRGFRVELGEIVTAIEAEESVQTSLVISQQSESGEAFLIAYLVKNKLEAAQANELDDLSSKIKSAIIKRIPSYMVPNHYIWLDTLPLLPNGKIDRSKLPNLETMTSTNQWDETNHPIEAHLIKKWKVILNKSKINRSNSFSELGGDSLSYIQVALATENAIGWLPEDWEKTSIKKLAELAKQESIITTSIDSTVLIRAVSIVLIVMTHFTNIHIAATHALFYLSGVSLGKYQLANIVELGSINPLIKTIKKIALPTFIAVLAIQLRHLNQLDMFNLTLMGNLRITQGEIRHFWFVEVLIQCLILIACLFSWNIVRMKFRKNPFEISIILMFLSISIAMLTSGLLFPQAGLAAGLPTNPINKIWLIFLGIAVVYADKTSKKIFVSLATIFGFALSTQYEPYLTQAEQNIFSMTAILFTIYIHKIGVFKVLANPIRLLASSSLFIYLTHFTFGGHLNYPSFNSHVYLKVIAMLVIGILAWKTWEKLCEISTQSISTLKKRNRSTTGDNLI